MRKTPALLDILDALLSLDRPYGLEIIERTGLPSGTVYPALTRLESEKWVRSWWQTEEPSARGPRKRLYELTPLGAEQARLAVAKRPASISRPDAVRPARPGLVGQ